MQSTPGAEPKVVHSAEAQHIVQRPKRKYPKPIPVPTAPTPDEISAVYDLAETWAAACRVAFERRRWLSPLRSEAWRGPGTLDPKTHPREHAMAKKQLRRWRAFYRMQMMLTEHKIDPIQYCVAIAWNHANRHTRPIPNPASMSGEAGRNIWWWWHTRLTQYESQKWVGVMDRVRAEAAASIASQEDRLRPLLRSAWDECKKYGTHQTVTLTWEPEVVWLLCFNEPAAKRNIIELLARPGSEYAPKMRAALREIWDSPNRQVWLQKVYVRTFGPRRGQLPEFPISDEQMQALAAQRAQQKRLEQSRAREEEELREAGFRQAAHTMMAAARHRQQVRWAREGGRS